jgi:hypothetical protein
MSTKQLLKTAHQCIKDENWTEAKDLCESIIEDEENFTAYLFLGIAFQNLKEYSEVFAVISLVGRAQRAIDKISGYRYICRIGADGVLKSCA